MLLYVYVLLLLGDIRRYSLSRRLSKAAYKWDTIQVMIYAEAVCRDNSA